MSSGELLTTATIWIAISAYAAGAFALSISVRRPTWVSAARVIWTIAVVGLAAHIACAFQYYHAWSHAAAFRDTARQTQEVFGLNWGGGLYINYLLLIGWVVDVGWWWLAGLDSYLRRPRLVVLAWHLFLIFIIFNATVVFEGGIRRWAGLAICLVTCLVWFHLGFNNPGWKSSYKT